MTDAVRDPGATPFTLHQFVEAGRERLRMTVAVGGNGLAREVLEPMTNRPGLALTGYYGDFAWRRIQLIGQAEQGYLQSLPPEVRLERVKALFDRQAYCLIFTCGTDIPQDIAQIAREADAVILKTELLTRVFSHQCTFVLERLGAPKVK